MKDHLKFQILINCSVKVNVPRLKLISSWLSSSKCNVIWDKTDLFVLWKNVFLGFLNISWPGSLSSAKLYKIGSQTSFTLDPITRSYFEWILSIQVMLIDFSHF